MTSTPPDLETRHALVFAIAHELGNHLAGIRLEAHLLDEEHGASGLARSSLTIDSLAGQSAPLLALLRPLLAPGSRRGAAESVRIDALLDGLRRQLEEEGLHGRALELDLAPEAAVRPFPFEGAVSLLTAIIGPPSSLPADRGPIRLAATTASGAARAGAPRSSAAADELVLVCELPGAALVEATPDRAARASALRGRALAVAIAHVLAADAGGRVDVEVEPDGRRSRFCLRVPS